MAMLSFLKRLLARVYGAAPAPVVPEAEASPRPEINRISGRVVRAGAFEFLAETPLGEVRGRLSDPEGEPGDGAPVEIAIPAACIRLDLTPPEENVFPGRVLSCEESDGRFFIRFATTSGPELAIVADEAPPECEPEEPLYAWVLPEDVVGG